ncbi:hypothetical protein Bca101_090746 [Brassica carinata]
MVSATLSRISLAVIAAMGQNLALNIAEKGFLISVYNRTTSKVVETLERAAVEGNLPVSGQYSPRDFVLSLRIPIAVLRYRAVTSTYYRGAVGGMLVIILIGAFMKGRGVGASGVGRTRFLLLQHRKATAKGPGKTLATLQKKKMEMISRRVLNETDFSCSDGIAQNKETTARKAGH